MFSMAATVVRYFVLEDVAAPRNDAGQFPGQQGTLPAPLLEW
jgi:hypothetical protein